MGRLKENDRQLSPPVFSEMLPGLVMMNIAVDVSHDPSRNRMGGNGPSENTERAEWYDDVVEDADDDEMVVGRLYAMQVLLVCEGDGVGRRMK